MCFSSFGRKRSHPTVHRDTVSSLSHVPGAMPGPRVADPSPASVQGKLHTAALLPFRLDDLATNASSAIPREGDRFAVRSNLVNGGVHTHRTNVSAALEASATASELIAPSFWDSTFWVARIGEQAGGRTNHPTCRAAKDEHHVVMTGSSITSYWQYSFRETRPGTLQHHVRIRPR